MPSVLFVCTANQFRSPLAAAFLLKSTGADQAAQEWRIESAGTWTQAGRPAAALAVKIASRLGLPNVKGHATRQVSMDLLDQFDLIITMEKGQLEAIVSEFHIPAGRAILLSEAVDGVSYDIPDPVDQMNDPEEVASELQMLIDKGAQRILGLAESLHKTREAINKSDL